jgi:hypothetical protein
VVVIVAIVIALLVRNRGRERHARQANELRTHAAAQSTDVEQAQREAAARQAAADQAAEEAQLAQSRAEEAQRESLHAEARQEDTLREADRLDPGVDHTSTDYEPGDVTPPRRQA